MIVTSVQIKTAKTQKHLYCLVFTRKALVLLDKGFLVVFALGGVLLIFGGIINTPFA